MISHSNNATLIQLKWLECSLLLRTSESAAFARWGQNRPHLTAPFNAVVLKRIWLLILIVTYKYSWPNWDARKSPDNREIRIIEVRLYFADSKLANLSNSSTSHTMPFYCNRVGKVQVKMIIPGVFNYKVPKTANKSMPQDENPWLAHREKN